MTTDPAGLEPTSSTAPTLPGLEPPAPTEGDVERAARRTLTALDAAGALEETRAVLAQALLTTARQLDRATIRGGKDYGVANLVAQLRETFTTLVPEAPAGGGEGDAFDRLARELGRAATLRDTPQP